MDLLDINRVKIGDYENTGHGRLSILEGARSVPSVEGRSHTSDERGGGYIQFSNAML